MPESTTREPAALKTGERILAGCVGATLLIFAIILFVAPPERRVALARCTRAAEGCIVSVDGDPSTFAVLLAGIGAAAGLIALINIRFNRVKVGSAELGYERETAGLATAAPPTVAEPEPPVSLDSASARKNTHLRIDVSTRGERLGVAQAAITVLDTPIQDVDSEILRDYQSARKISQRSFFLTHILGQATQAGQRFSVAIRVTPHRDATAEVKSAKFYFGKAWGSRIFEGKRGSDGRFGIVTEAYGPFLALCQVEFADGTRLLLDHYCDFDMGSLLTS